MMTMAVAAVAMAGCVPPAATPPTMPAATGVGWVHDLGGSLNEFGSYVPGYQRFSVLGGVGSGPDAVPSGYSPPLAAVGSASFTNIGVFPDGSARFPWNGFAREGISTVSSPVAGGRDHVVSGPGGSCTVSDRSNAASRSLVLSVQPSPDGTKLAIVSKSWSMEGPIQTGISIISFAGPCATTASTSYSWSSYGGEFSGDQILNPVVVWAPDSSAVVYSLAGTAFYDTHRLMRLDAVQGASPSLVFDEPGSQVMALGWSVGGRILIARGKTSTSPANFSSSLETLAVAGGPAKAFSVLSSSVARFDAGVGFFVPGTQTVVYVGGGQTVTNVTGQKFYRPELRLFDDIANGDGPLAGADLPLLWHQQDGVDVPNSVALDAFVR